MHPSYSYSQSISTKPIEIFSFFDELHPRLVPLALLYLIGLFRLLAYTTFARYDILTFL